MNSFIYVCNNCARHIFFFESSVKSEYTENNEYIVTVDELKNVYFSRTDILCANCRRKLEYQFLDEDRLCCMHGVKVLPAAFIMPSVNI